VTEAPEIQRIKTSHSPPVKSRLARGEQVERNVIDVQ
jgi:hypothetical protein